MGARRTFSVIATAIALAIFVPASTATACSGGWAFKESERGFAKHINLSRGAVGRNRLRLDPELSKAARKHTTEMINRDTLYHTPSNLMRRRVTNWTWLGENVGVGGTVASLHTAFMNSPDHKDNILFRKFRHVGVGTKEANGRLWVTVIFEARSNPGTTLHMPAC